MLAAVLPSWSRRSRRAPLASNNRTTSAWPFAAASIKAVCPASSRASIATPWPVTRHVNGWLAARYGTEVKATRERYFELVLRYSDRMRTQSDAHQLLLGLLQHSDDMFPGYGERALAWSRDLYGLLHQPGQGRSYLELCAPLMEGGVARYLLRDGTHLSAAGHQRIAELVTPVLQSLIVERSSSQPR